MPELRFQRRDVDAIEWHDALEHVGVAPTLVYFLEVVKCQPGRLPTESYKVVGSPTLAVILAGVPVSGCPLLSTFLAGRAVSIGGRTLSGGAWAFQVGLGIHRWQSAMTGGDCSRTSSARGPPTGRLWLLCRCRGIWTGARRWRTLGDGGGCPGIIIIMGWLKCACHLRHHLAVSEGVLWECSSVFLRFEQRPALLSRPRNRRPLRSVLF